MCKACAEFEPAIVDDKAIYRVYNAPHQFLSKGVDRFEYFESIRQGLVAWVLSVSMCPEKSDIWLDGEKDLTVTRGGFDWILIPDDASELEEPS